MKSIFIIVLVILTFCGCQRHLQSDAEQTTASTTELQITTEAPQETTLVTTEATTETPQAEQLNYRVLAPNETIYYSRFLIAGGAEYENIYSVRCEVNNPTENDVYIYNDTITKILVNGELIEPEYKYCFVVTESVNPGGGTEFIHYLVLDPLASGTYKFVQGYYTNGEFDIVSQGAEVMIKIGIDENYAPYNGRKITDINLLNEQRVNRRICPSSLYYSRNVYSFNELVNNKSAVPKDILADYISEIQPAIFEFCGEEMYNLEFKEIFEGFDAYLNE